MPQNDKIWHPNFIKYMNYIANHENYKGLPASKKSDGTIAWIATAKSDIGQQRITWCINKAHDLGFIKNYEQYPGLFADVMLEIHPTKWKVCQVCGKEMSLYYHYPNAYFLKDLNRRFNSNFSDCDHISYIWDNLIHKGIKKADIAAFLIEKGDLNLNPCRAQKDEIISELEYACRKGNKSCLGPGAMSDFPDRFDGFHTYNRCCRSSQDKGRSKSNLKSYTKDRRAFEYWSEGNIHAADQFMCSHYFDGVSADHIGPISLGFIHDPHYIQPMTVSDNSAKRDRLQVVDINKIIGIQNDTDIYPMSWQSRLLWEYICSNYTDHPDKVSTVYRDALKQNMANYMYILLRILLDCPNNGKSFLENAYLKPNYRCFNYSYEFNEKGEIIKVHSRHFTDKTKLEIDRYKRVAFESVYDYGNKENRHSKNDMTRHEQTILSRIASDIESGIDCSYGKKLIKDLMGKRSIKGWQIGTKKSAP